MIGTSRSLGPNLFLGDDIPKHSLAFQTSCLNKMNNMEKKGHAPGGASNISTSKFGYFVVYCKTFTPQARFDSELLNILIFADKRRSLCLTHKSIFNKDICLRVVINPKLIKLTIEKNGIVLVLLI
jgi:hypothetical protein